MNFFGTGVDSVGLESVASGPHASPFDDIAQLPDVAGPVVTREFIDRAATLAVSLAVRRGR